jgi:Flp pilus assembly CpaF family ATPase
LNYADPELKAGKASGQQTMDRLMKKSLKMNPDNLSGMRQIAVPIS